MGRAEEIFDKLVVQGEPAIDEMIARRATEELFLDFKRSADNGEGTKFHPRDRENLARAISGFGNSEGGVVIWGVECSPDSTGADVARAKVTIADPARFVAWLESAMGGCTIPAHVGVRHHGITIQDGRGFAATLVPQSDHMPHQIAGDYRYLMRVGSNFSPVSHGLLSGMFGRAPRPKLVHQYTSWRLVVKNGGVFCEFGLTAVNAGPGIARDVFANVEVHSPGDASQVQVRPGDEKVWTHSMAFLNLHSVIVHEGVRMPPETVLHPVTLAMNLRPPFQGALRIGGMVGATGAAPHRFELNATAQHVAIVHAEYAGGQGQFGKEVAVPFLNRLFGLEEL